MLRRNIFLPHRHIKKHRNSHRKSYCDFYYVNYVSIVVHFIFCVTSVIKRFQQNKNARNFCFRHFNLFPYPTLMTIAGCFIKTKATGLFTFPAMALFREPLLENPVKQTPQIRTKLTPFFRSKLTPVLRSN